MQVETIKAEPRSELGTRAVRRLREAGRIPATVYGHGEAPLNISLVVRDVQTVVAHGTHVLNVDMGGKLQACLLKDVQFDHLGAIPMHVDFSRIDLNERVRVKVPLEMRGQAKGLGEGGSIEQQIIDLEVECLAVNIPDSIRVNVTNLGVHQALHVRELELPEGVTAVHDGDSIVVLCREITEKAAAAPAVEGAEGAAEPEVIAKGKVEKEGEEEKE